MQETSTWIHEILFNQLLVGILSVVLQRQTELRIQTVPYFWIASLEANVGIFIHLRKDCNRKNLMVLWLLICRFYFDFSMTYVGAGMICSHLVNLSLLLGAVLSYGIMWPLIDRLKGHWFSESLKESDMKSLYGYKVSLLIST